MSAPPKTLLHASAAQEAAIRAAVREARGLDLLGGRRRLAHADDATAFAAFLSDPAVSDPIYDLPRPFTEANVRAWIEERIARHARGENVLCFTFDDAGAIVAYSEVTVWPQHASAELAGAMRRGLQNSGQGGAGALAMFSWMFEGLGAELICLTAALDNVRSQALIDHAGFVRMGGRTAVRPDGSTRESVYWEMTRADWRARMGG